MTNLNTINLLILALATWRISSMLATEKGPYDIFGKLRKIAGVIAETTYSDGSAIYKPTGILSELILCIWCLSPWIGALLILLYLAFGLTFIWVCLPFALSAAAIMVDKCT